MPSFRGAYSGLPNPMGRHTSYASWANSVSRASAQDRAHELNMRELEYMAARQALGLDSRGRQTGQGYGDLSNQFLDAWNQTLMASQGVYNEALEAYRGSYDWMRDARESASRLGDMAGTLEQEYQQFRTDFSGLEQDFRTRATEELQARRELGGQLQGLAVADYEGAAGRAMADVATQAEMGRAAEARRMASMGIDPTSGRAMATMGRMGADEAASRAIAANVARRGEKERVTGITGQAMALFDPAAMASQAMAIRGAGTSMMQSAAGLRQAETGALTNLAGMQGQIAQGMGNIGTSMATAIGGQQADVAGLMAGLAYQSNQNIMGGAVNPYNMSPYTRGAGATSGMNNYWTGLQSASYGGGGYIGTPQYNQDQSAARADFFSGAYQQTPPGYGY